MKIKNLILVLFLFVAAILQAQDETFLSKIKISEFEVEKTSHRNVKVHFNMDFKTLNLNKQQTITVVPVIASSSGDNEVELPSVVISGKIRNKVQYRQSALNRDTKNFKVLDTLKFESDMDIYKYEAMVPFKKWMIGGEIKIYANIEGCASCEGSHEESNIEGIGEVFPPYTPDYTYTYVYAMREEKKAMKYTGKLVLGFTQNSSAVNLSYNNNELTIDSIKNFIANPYYEIKDIELISYASPEGKDWYNQLISERRSQSFISYLKNNVEGMESYQMKWSAYGEDWERFRQEVENMCGLDTKTEVLEIIDNRGDNLDQAEDKVKHIGVETYSRLYRDVYPLLRRTDYKITYMIRNFSVNECRNLLNKFPELLDLYEIQVLADTYEKGSKEYVAIWKKAASSHPDDVNILNNAAIALLETGHTEEVILLLGNTIDNPSLKNLLGIAYARRNQFELAYEIFKQAIEAGEPHASTNLKKLEYYWDYISE